MSKNKISKRSITRLVAVQSLYQYDFYQRKTDIDILSKQLLEEYFLTIDQKEPISYHNKIEESFLASLLSAINFVDDIDQEIVKYLKDGWSIDNLPDMVLHILRLAIFEMKYLKDIPKKVVINEYVDLTSCFYEDKKAAFVNGVLNSLKDKLNND